MPASPDTSGAARRGLSVYLRALWDISPRLATLPTQGDAARTLLGIAGSRPMLHLPADGDDGMQRARAAHAAAHLAHGGAQQARAKLKPVQRALFEALEDARVEWLAMQTLPGLRRLWAPFHVADARWGNGFDALLVRLAHCLFDSTHEDPHDWLTKVRGLFFAPDGSLALDTPARLREAASLLGNDIGQMRLPFNPSGWQVEPAYRDDNHHIWLPDERLPPSLTPLELELPDTQGAAGSDDADTTFERPPPQGMPDPDAGDGADSVLRIEAALRTLHYPEWDRLIGRLRPHWCTVIETVAPAASASALRVDVERRLARTVRLLRGAAVSDRRPTRGRSEHGDLLHSGALIDADIALRSRRDPGRRLYRDSAARVEPVEVLLLVDTSASTAFELEPGRRVLDALRDTAWLAAAALEDAGHRSAIQGFASDTRHLVRVQRVKDFGERALDGAVLASAGGLASGGSTRMGAAIRHAAGQMRSARRVIALLTDGEPHDVDIHDPRYLTDDLAHALAEVRRSGIATLCLHFAQNDAPGPLKRLFPAGHYRSLRNPDRLAHALMACIAASA